MWKIYYGDGLSVGSECDPFTVPTRNAQMIAVSDADHGWYLVRSNDYYWYLGDGNWNGGDIFGLFDYLISSGPKKVLFGRTIGNAEFQEILKRATEDPDLPRKTGWRHGEHRP